MFFSLEYNQQPQRQRQQHLTTLVPGSSSLLNAPPASTLSSSATAPPAAKHNPFKMSRPTTASTAPLVPFSDSNSAQPARSGNEGDPSGASLRSSSVSLSSASASSPSKTAAPGTAPLVAALAPSPPPQKTVSAPPVVHIDTDQVHFHSPSKDQCRLFVGNLNSDVDELAVHEFFRHFGLVFNVRLRPSSLVIHGEQFSYAFVCFYSAWDALSALTTFSSPEKWRAFTRDKGQWTQTMRIQPCSSKHAFTRRLSTSECMLVANHFLGFNGWSLQIVSVDRTPDVKNSRDQNCVRCRAIVRVYFYFLQKCSDVYWCEGRGEVLQPLALPKNKPVAYTEGTHRAINTAISDAFSRVCLVRQRNGAVIPRILSGNDLARWRTCEAGDVVQEVEGSLFDEDEYINEDDCPYNDDSIPVVDGEWGSSDADASFDHTSWFEDDPGEEDDADEKASTTFFMSFARDAML